jgi:hypothetical protein
MWMKVWPRSWNRGQPRAPCYGFSGLSLPLQASPGTPGGVKPSLCSVPGDCTMTSICPFFSRKSFSPEKAQIELACLGAAVSSSEPDPKTSGVPGGPFTSPPNAAPALVPTMATAETTTAKNDLVCMLSPFLEEHCCACGRYKALARLGRCRFPRCVDVNRAGQAQRRLRILATLRRTATRSRRRCRCSATAASQRREAPCSRRSCHPGPATSESSTSPTEMPSRPRA